MPTITYTYTNAGHNLLRNGMEGADNPKIVYVALGTSNTAPAASDTKLGTEAFRKAVTSYTNGSTGEVIFNGYIAPSDAVGVGIQEVGWFGGNGATATANTGVLLARGLYNHSKLATESIQLSLDFTT